MIRSRIPLVPVAVAAVVGCNGNCSQNAVFITTQAQQFAPVVDTIEVYTDSNGDGLVGPADLSERGFVVDARSGLRAREKSCRSNRDRNGSVRIDMNVAA